ncbi:MAG TPA: acyl carrier protein [Polyangiaceae bacterium]|jgi:acyl carrier protein|nr:acyl carrier protein [Polyangiaceae bacterium]
MTTKERVRQFIETNFYIADKSQLLDDTSLLDKGMVDSTGILEVVAFLESDFGIQVDDTEILPENLDSIERIAAYIAKKTG